MSVTHRLLTRIGITVVAAGALAVSAVAAAPAGAAVPPTAPPIVGTPAGVVRATAMPTAQINGVGYAQVIIGNTVYVGGDFTAARPAGVAAGGPGEVTRDNLMAYSLSTGELIASFAPDVNNEVKALAASPDGTRLYVGGLFTAIDGTPRYRIAAFDTATGALVPTFKPIPSYVVNSITATNSTVYFGGKFNNVSGVDRANLAAVRKDTGAVLAWAPVADSTVQAVVLSPNHKYVVLGGNFGNLNGVTAHGLGSVNVSAGATVPFAANQVVNAWGPKAAFLSLSTDGTNVYGTAYNFAGTGNLEGTVAANPNTGAIVWVEDCHGDTYSAWSSGSTVYTVGHAHFCGNIGGFPQVPTAGAAHRAVAFTAAAGGTVQTNTQAGYQNLAGQPAPSIRQWFPDLVGGGGNGGSDQAAWSVTGTKGWVTMAGEFPTVNGTAQQGLVRFATAPTSPDTLGPALNGDTWPVTASAAGATGATIAIGSNWDRDDLSLQYKVTRDQGSGTAAKTIYSKSLQAVQWSLPALTFGAADLKPGVTYRFRVFASDAAGNTVASPFVSYTVPSS